MIEVCPTIRVVIISDDWHYMKGLSFLLSKNVLCCVECIYLGGNNIFNFSDLHVNSQYVDNILFIAVEDLGLIKNITDNDLNLFRVLVSINHVKNHKVLFKFDNAVFISRCYTIKELLKIISDPDAGQYIYNLKLPSREAEVIFAYFSIFNRKKLLDFLNGIDMKYISRYQILFSRRLSLTNKIEAFFIIKSLLEYRMMNVSGGMY